MYKNLLSESKEIENDIIKYRRYLHEKAETGFELSNTIQYVKSKLEEFGCETELCGKNGIIAVIGKKSKPCVLLRADMDALPIKEESDVCFSCKNGNMHACGHDMHTAMLLGAARLLKKYESKINGAIKLMFQPAEEILSGAKNMIDNGVLQNPEVRCAMMIHVMAGLPLKTGTAIVSSGGVGAPSAQYFTVNIQGKGCHGSTPQQGVDALTIAAHTLIAFQEITARELGVSDEALLTVGSLKSGTAGNIIPDTAVLEGTIRAYNDEIGEYIKKRITDISDGVAKTFRGKANVVFGAGCPTLLNNEKLSQQIEKNIVDLLGKDKVFNTNAFGTRTNKSGGSEDFSYVSHIVPSVMVALAAGNSDEGYVYPQHHPKVKFDEDVLAVGSAILAYNGMKLSEILK